MTLSARRQQRAGDAGFVLALLSVDILTGIPGRKGHREHEEQI